MIFGVAFIRLFLTTSLDIRGGSGFSKPGYPTRPDDTFLKPEPARVWISKPAGTRLHVFSDEIQIDQQNDHIFWWFPKGKIIYPLLFKAKYFCMAATSVPSERFFFQMHETFWPKASIFGNWMCKWACVPSLCLSNLLWLKNNEKQAYHTTMRLFFQNPKI